MAYFSWIIKVSCFVAVVGVFLAVCPENDALIHLQKPVWALIDRARGFLNTCPLHWSNSEKVTQNLDQSKGVYNVIKNHPSDRIFTKAELSKYDGSEGSPGLYLGILGLVYDVSKGEKYYGPGNGYAFFAARDGTKAFMSGDFTEKGLVDEVTGLTPGQMLELERWIKFYDETYVYKGRLIGNFYDDTGRPTDALRKAVEGIHEGHAEENSANKIRERFPHCNSHFKKDVGGRVWCSDQSGGKKRDWVGVPRKFFNPGTTKPRCACVRDNGPPSDQPDSSKNRGDLDYPGLELYEGCDPLSVSCTVSNS